MNYLPPPINTVPFSDHVGDSPQDSLLLNQMVEDAKAFVNGFSWCSGVREVRFGLGVGGLILVAAVNIVPAHAEVDDWIWVVVGDVPKMYLRADELRTPREALEGYVRELKEWLLFARGKRNADEVYPLGVQPTKEIVDMLASRVSFLEVQLLPSA